MKNKNKKKNKIKNSKITKRKKYNKEVDLWKEIRTNLKPLILLLPFLIHYKTQRISVEIKY